jgi:hypothetical protein
MSLGAQTGSALDNNGAEWSLKLPCAIAVKMAIPVMCPAFMRHFLLVLLPNVESQARF